MLNAYYLQQHDESFHFSLKFLPEDMQLPIDNSKRRAYHPPMPGYSRITVHLEKQQIETLQEVATSTGVPVSVLVRNAVTQFLRKRSIPLFLPPSADMNSATATIND
jgi:hypothetical protein